MPLLGNCQIDHASYRELAMPLTGNWTCLFQGIGLSSFCALAMGWCISHASACELAIPLPAHWPFLCLHIGHSSANAWAMPLSEHEPCLYLNMSHASTCSLFIPLPGHQPCLCQGISLASARASAMPLPVMGSYVIQLSMDFIFKWVFRDLYLRLSVFKWIQSLELPWFRKHTLHNVANSTLW
jgi:hypothetical protein